MSTIRSVTFHDRPQGAQTAIVGRMFRNRRVLAINGSDPTTIVLDQGEIVSIPAGCVVRVEHVKEGASTR